MGPALFLHHDAVYIEQVQIMSHRHFPFVVLEIEAENLQRAASFYSAIFGWTFAHSVVQRGALDADLGADHDTTVRV